MLKTMKGIKTAGRAATAAATNGSCRFFVVQNVVVSMRNIMTQHPDYVELWVAHKSRKGSSYSLTRLDDRHITGALLAASTSKRTEVFQSWKSLLLEVVKQRLGSSIPLSTTNIT
jgi:hypothetical protein